MASNIISAPPNAATSMPADELRHDTQLALLYVWLILGCLSGLAVISPLLLSPEFLFHLLPVCQAKAAGGQCVFCGMTTAFVHIGQGEFVAAQSANSGALPLYLSLTLNFVASIAYTMMRVIQACRSLA
jgi:uncharacterized protein DUF2752